MSVDGRYRRVYAAIPGDGATQLQALIDAAGAASGGTVYLRNGVYTIASTLTLDTDFVYIEGESMDGVRLQYSGSGTAIDITAPQYCGIRNVTLTDIGTGTHGVVVGHSAATTGYGYTFNHVVIDGFSTAGLHAANIEHSSFDRVLCRNNGTGFLIDASRHSSTAAGISNSFQSCRALSNTGAGWDVGNQTASTFENCQALTNDTADATYQFVLRGTCVTCRLIGLDVEDSAQTRNGVSIGGSAHVIEGAQLNGLDVGIALRTASYCRVGPIRAASDVTTVLSIDAASANNLTIGTAAYSAKYTDSSASTTDL